MRVRATVTGLYGGLIRKPGDEFELKSESERGRWMEDVGPPKKRRGRPPKVRPEEVEDNNNDE